MASVITATSPAAGLLALGGFRDPLNLVSALADATSLSFVTVTGGGTLAAGDVAIVRDGQGITLPAAPANGSVIVVVNGVPAVNLTVTAGSGDTVNGAASIVVGSFARGFKYNSAGTNWVMNT